MTIPAGISAEIWERADILCDQFRDVVDDRELIARVLIATGQGGATNAGLTHAQAEAMTFIRNYQTANSGISPTCEEIGNAMGRSKGNVHGLLQRMKKRGVIATSRRSARSITILARA